jgi:hypothetical protein
MEHSVLMAAVGILRQNTASSEVLNRDRVLALNVGGVFSALLNAIDQFSFRKSSHLDAF